jgi:predicted nuclease of predicted toxin-antitoxin system
MTDGREIFIRLYIDEDVHGSIGEALRRKGYDVISVHDIKRDGLSDAEQLSYAVQEDRAIFSFNAVDYIELHIQYLKDGKKHSGIIISKQLPFSETLQRLLKLLEQVSVDEIRNQLRWLS